MVGDKLSGFDRLWDYNDPATTETRFRALLDAAESQPAIRLELLTQIARAQGLQRRFEDAHATLDEVEPALTGAPPRPRIRYLLERGRVFNSAGARERARPYFEGALALAGAIPAEASYAVDAAHMMAIIAPADEALDWNLRALAMAEAAEDERARRWRGSLYNNIGWTYHAAGDYPAAMTYLERSLEFRREFGPPAEERVARWCVARVRRDLGQVREALAEQRALLAENEALGEPDGFVLEEIAECLLLLGDEEAARPYFAAAFAGLSANPWLAAEEPERLERLRLLGQGSEP